MAIKMEIVEDYLGNIFYIIVNVLKLKYVSLLQIFRKAMILYKHARCRCDGDIFINGNSAVECS